MIFYYTKCDIGFVWDENFLCVKITLKDFPNIQIDADILILLLTLTISIFVVEFTYNCF